MHIEYDSEANALYIRFRDTKPADNIDIEDGNHREDRSR